MKVTVLGMWGGFPQPGEATSGYLLETQNSKVLLDCGSGVVGQLLKYCDINQLDAVVISHYHADHSCDVGVLQYARLVHQAMSGLSKCLPIYGFDHSDFGRLSYIREQQPITEGVLYEANQSFSIGDMTFIPFRTLHAVPCHGCRVISPEGTICYTADGGFTEQQIEAAEQVDLLISEANFSHEDVAMAEGNHMTGTQVGMLATQAKVKLVLLTHLPPLRPHEPIIREVKEVYSGPVRIASMGAIIEV